MFVGDRYRHVKIRDLIYPRRCHVITREEENHKDGSPYMSHATRNAETLKSYLVLRVFVGVRVAACEERLVLVDTSNCMTASEFTPIQRVGKAHRLYSSSARSTDGSSNC